MKYVALALGLWACGNVGAKVGDSCEKGDECPNEGFPACIQTWPDGYCTELQCVLGSCPAGSVCVRGIRFPDAPYDAFCLATCTSDADCREGYRCGDVSLPEKACAPRAR